MKFINVLVLAAMVLSVASLSSCSKDDKLEGIDKELYDLASSTSGYTWFENSSAYLDKSSGSGHNFPFYGHGLILLLPAGLIVREEFMRIRLSQKVL